MKTYTSNAVRRPLSLRNRGTVAALGMAATVLATPVMAQKADKEVELETLRIEDRTADVNPNAEPGAPYKARTSGDERLTRPIAELPQTMTVLTEEQIEDSGYTDLARILDSQPGITVGTGENGNAFGDRYIIRGQEARSDVFVDGLRDPGMTTRESFAVDQIEISKGPSSTFAGRGTAGGAINLITKQATTDYDFIKASVGLGEDRYVRTTLDANLVASDHFAVRANVLYAHTNTPDRAPADRDRKGLAISGTYMPSDVFDITLDYYGFRGEDNADLGDFLSGSATDGDRRPVNTPVYAQKEDFQKSDVDVFTGRLHWQLSDSIRLSNKMRYGMSDNGYVVTGARGTTTDASDPNGEYDTISFSTHQGWQEVDYFANQANLHIESEMLGGKNDLIIGAEYTDHTVVNGVYSVDNTGTTNCVVSGRGGTNPSYCGIGPNGQVVNGLNTLLGRQITKDRWDSDWQVKTVSLYLMDTIDLTEGLTLFGGARWDHFDYTLTTQNNSLERTTYDYSDSFWNAQAGLTYEVAEGAILYASFATAADINGGESDLGTNAGYGGLVIIDGEFRGGKPERSINWELGTKLNLFDEKFLLTAAVFQTTKSDVFEASGGGYTPDGTGNTGKNRVRGFELGLAGNITPEWSMQGGFTLLETEILESASDPLSVGKTLSNAAKFQASFMTKYQIGPFALGFAVKHKSKRYGGQPDTAPSFSTLADGSFVYSQPVPAYTVADLFAEYRFNRNLDFRLNVNNVTNEDYYLTVYRSGSFLYKGDARQIVGTLNLRF
ncbi:TonB-dependent receptor [Novosphingobium marinum]|uniref:Catecholate siderophore receptor n=1 Tax=Novosphingobium marinum TaxID=1514948 RepID=A0A7Y9Y160_9SPHN|nr:TonB-dependent receptor [Novosphingobium marinum]NYH97065.1 catecholate siderophore receptor [Novosphingobium marinum]GGC43287.1 TonB-dependent receptor [Novosphingobium marinum]